MTNTNWLAQKFIDWREVVEAAETPFSKLAVFVLPIIAPMVPASFTGLHMFRLLLAIFGEKYSILCGMLALIVAIVLELLGYVGAITFIKSVYDLVKNGRDEYLIPMIINFFAYVFYLVLMFMVNVKLGEYFETPKIINSIIGWLSFITVPTGLLAANYLSSKERKEDENNLRRDNNDFRLKKAALKQGINIFAPQTRIYPAEVKTTKKNDWRQLTADEKHEVVYVLSVPEIIKKYGVSRATAFNWKKSKLD